MNKFVIAILACMLAAYCAKAPEAEKAKVDAGKQQEAVKAPEGKEAKLDVQKSIVKWIGTKVTGRHNGSIKIKSGSVFVKDGKITGGSFIIDMTTIENIDLKGNAEFKGKLEGHLRSPDFFDVEKNPEAKFEITSVDAPTGDKSNVSGNLTIKGIKKNISFPAKITIDAKKGSASAIANFNINRHDWNVSYKGKPDDLIRDEINLDLTLSTL